MANIYALSLDGVDHRYIGATTQKIHRRLTGHKQNALQPYRRGTAPVYDWMREVGPNNVIATLIDRVPDSDIHEAERRWISNLRAQGFDLLNETDGGPGRPGPHPPEDVARVAAGHIGKKRGPYNWADVSKQVASGAKAAHNRWHVGRGIVKDDCTFCST